MPEISNAASILLGGVAGSFAEAFVMPALVVRTRMMVQGADSSLIAYRGFFDCVRTMFRDEGIGAFYKGVGLSVAFTPLARGLYMAGVEGSHRTLGHGTATLDFAAGMNAQLLSSIAYVPRDVVIERCAIDGQLSTQVGSTASSRAALRTIFSAEGMRGFYRGIVPHALRSTPQGALTLLAYEYTLPMFKRLQL